ncbi:hypothetical protein BDZ97DRAFT_187123 [Flammula alnicola]|nr:hypothetical protein BDZ97DRAFT_187123 [Flammula alnicola]
MSQHCPFCGSTENQGVYDNDTLCSKSSNLNPCDPCKRLAELDIQIIKAREIVREMQREAQRLKSEMNCSHDHLIHRLPPEISSYIFQLCISRKPSADARYTQVALSSVCQKWRQIAHTTPQVWTTVFLPSSQHNALSVPRWAQEWIDRSGQLPLSIGLFIKSEPNYYSVNRDVIAVISQCSSRWRDLTYQGPTSSLSYLVGDSQGASQLQTLKLDVYGSRSTRQFKLGYFKPTPTTLRITGLDLKSVVIEWNNITHMQAGHVSADNCWELFRIAPRMTHCQLKNVLDINAQDPFPRPHTPILHPTLQVLEMSLTHYSFGLVLNNVSLPSLKSYMSDVGGGYLETESLISLFLRSSCSLQTLTLSSVRISVADLVDLSRATPDLRHLDLKSYYRSGADVTERIFRCFSNAFTITSTDSETNQALFPQLQSMTFKGAMPIDWKLVSDIFGSPSDVCNLRRRPLRSFTLSSVKAQPIDDFIIDKDTLRRMLLLVAQGIELKIEQEYPSIDALQRSIEFHAHDSALGDSLRDPNRLGEE